MLNPEKSKHHFFIVYLLISSLQLVAAYHNQLFVDEAFYWLEGQWLSWSYSEVPGWAPWTLAFADLIFPKHQFFIRVPNLMAMMSLPWLAMLLAKETGADDTNTWQTGLLVLALPLLGIAGSLAIPDVWIVLFTLLAMLLLAKAINKNQIKFYVWLGVILAIGLNVHLRFWVIVMLAGTVFMWIYSNQKRVLLPLVKYSLPLMLIGFIPIIVFNLQNDFVLLTFQLKDRHPWEFQASHASFLLVQILITTPIVFWVCLQPILFDIKNTIKPTWISGIIYTSGLHWLLYALVGFFSDNLRFNLHWTLVSYVLLLVVAANSKSSKSKQWAWLSGVFVNVAVLVTLLVWLHGPKYAAGINTRITSNAEGWQELAKKTDKLLLKEQSDSLLVDQFKTLAELKFYSQKVKTIKALPHPLNTKHGRATQLALMGLLHTESTSSQLLIVEQTALKLDEQIEFYQNACNQLNGLKLIDTFVVNHGIKNFHFFKTGGGQCMIPPVIYHEKVDGKIEGWVLKSLHQTLELSLETPSTDSNKTLALSQITKPLGNNPIFHALDAKDYHLLGFKITEIDDTLPMVLQLNSGDQLLLKYWLTTE